MYSMRGMRTGIRKCILFHVPTNNELYMIEVSIY